MGIPHLAKKKSEIWGTRRLVVGREEQKSVDLADRAERQDFCMPMLRDTPILWE
jgi:hypothetical protein